MVPGRRQRAGGGRPGRAPGILSARYAADRCPGGASRRQIDRANNAKLLEALRDVDDEGRVARFVCCLALADGERILLESRGQVEGRIARAEHGGNGFGYDPLFFVPELGKTTAELAAERKNAISHRGKAVRRFASALRDLLTPPQD